MAALRFDQHVRLYDYWNRQRRFRLMPARADLDTVEMGGRLLPHLTLLERGGDRFRYRVQASKVVDDTRNDYTGTLVGDHSSPSYGKALRGLLSAIIADGTPRFVTGLYQPKERARRVTSRLFLPLAVDGQTVDMIMVCRVAHNVGFDTEADWSRVISATIESVEPIECIEALTAASDRWERRFLAAPPLTRTLNVRPALRIVNAAF